MVHFSWKSLACTRFVCALALTVVALPAAADHHEGAAEHEHPAGQPQMSAEEQAMMAAYEAAGKPGAEHARLAESVGNWKSTVRVWMGPGDPMVSEATTTREMILDGRVLEEHFAGNMMGQPFTGHGMTGYDNTKKMFWSTWNDSMSTGIMLSWGKWDEAQKAVVFEGEMPDPQSGQVIKMKSVMRSPEPGKEVFEMWESRGPGGEMIRTMEITAVKQ
jgi:hypothetical protein